jgi:uncharacterized membrane protein YgcG
MRQQLLRREPLALPEGEPLAAVAAAGAAELAALVAPPWSNGCRCGHLTAALLSPYPEEALESMCFLRGLPVDGAGRRGRRGPALAARVAEHSAKQPPHCGAPGPQPQGVPALDSGERVPTPEDAEWDCAVEGRDARLEISHAKAVAHARALAEEDAGEGGDSSSSSSSSSGGGGGGDCGGGAEEGYAVCPCYAAGVGCTTETCSPCEANCANGCHVTSVHLDPASPSLHRRLLRGLIARAKAARGEGALFCGEEDVTRWRTRLARAIMAGPACDVSHGDDESCSGSSAAGSVATFLATAPEDPEAFLALLECVEEGLGEEGGAGGGGAAGAGAGVGDGVGGAGSSPHAPTLYFSEEAAALLMSAMEGAGAEEGEGDSPHN